MTRRIRSLLRPILAAFALCLMAAPAAGEWISVTHAVRAGVVLAPAHLIVNPGPTPPGALAEIDHAAGLEARVSLYPGRPVLAAEIGPPTLVRRNDIVMMAFSLNGLQLQTEGRALGDGGLGERVRIMNLDSRRTVWGVIAGDKFVEVR